MGKNTENLGGSAFWILFILFSLVGLTMLGLWSYFNDSVKAIVIAFIFFAMIISALVLSKFEIFDSGTWGENTVSFSIGFVMWLLIGSRPQSVISILSVSKNALMATIAADLPAIIDFTMTAIVIPIAEELLWLIAIPYVVISLMNLGKKKYKILGNLIVQIAVIAIVCGLSFALFHIGKLFLAFLVVAFIFRTIMIVSVVGDSKLNIIPGLNLVPAFALGAHIGNNWGQYGFVTGLDILTQNLSVGAIVIVMLIVIFISALNQVILWISGNKKSVIGK